MFRDTVKEAFGDMKFDVIIGNPPYQENVEGSTLSLGIYHKFIDKAIELKPRYMSMIVPSRWMSMKPAGIENDWLNKFRNDKHIRIMHDFEDASKCFQNVSIAGGVCYFLYDNENTGDCDRYYYTGDKVIEYDGKLCCDEGVIIRDTRCLPIIDKVRAVDGDKYTSNSFQKMVGPAHLFCVDRGSNAVMGTNWRGYSKDKDKVNYIKHYVNERNHGVKFGWVNELDIPRKMELVPLHKVYISLTGRNDSNVLNEPFYGEPNSTCSDSFTAILGNTNTKEECENIISYIKTKFFRYMVSIKKKTQHATQEVYTFVPMQDFSKSWTDAELYAKYKLTQEEIDFIESMIKPME